MNVTLECEVEDLVAEEIRAGRFESAASLLGTAVRHFLVARKFGDAEANKLATLREELLRADAQIDKSDCSEYEPDTLSELFQQTRQEALRRLKGATTESS
jgi:Arc/MetJ-type ribon-helix-helix transcriptional regulator